MFLQISSGFNLTAMGWGCQDGVVARVVMQRMTGMKAKRTSPVDIGRLGRVLFNEFQQTL